MAGSPSHWLQIVDGCGPSISKPIHLLISCLGWTILYSKCCPWRSWLSPYTVISEPPVTAKILKTCRTEPGLEVGRELAPTNQAPTWREGAPLPEAVDQNAWLSNRQTVHPLLAWGPDEGKLPSYPTAGSAESSGYITAEALRYCGKVCFQGGVRVILHKPSAGKMWVRVG